MQPIDLQFDPQLATSATGLTIQGFRNYQKTSSLVLRPAFQRNLVWGHEQKSYLIDSVLRGLPIPEIYVHWTTDAEGVEDLVIVDGQQRISTLLDFLTGKLVLGSYDDLDPQWRNKPFEEMHTDLKKRFRSYELIVRKLPELETPALREIFRRLNKTVEPLEPQELRHAAYTGEFIQLVEAAAQHDALTARNYSAGG